MGSKQREMLKYVTIILFTMTGYTSYTQEALREYARSLDSVSHIDDLFFDETKSKKEVLRVNRQSEFYANGGYDHHVGRIQDNRKNGVTEELIFYLVLARDGDIFFRQAYAVEFAASRIEPSFDVFHSEQDSVAYHQFLSDFEAINGRSFEERYLERIPEFDNRFGFACGIAGNTPRLCEMMKLWVQVGNMEGLEHWAFTFSATKQAYAYVGLSKLKRLNRISSEYAQSLRLDRIVDNDRAIISSCGGCMVESNTMAAVLASWEVHQYIYR